MISIKKKAETLHSMCDCPFFLREKICKHRGDVIVGWNYILLLKYSHFPCPLQWQITEQARRAPQYAPASDLSPGPLAVSQHALEMIKKQFESSPFTVGNSALVCPRWGANGRENREVRRSKEKGKIEPWKGFHCRGLRKDMQIKAIVV